MRAFVTGGGGFIGRHLVARLRDAGTEVRAIARSDASAVPLRGTDAKARRELGYGPRDLEAGLTAVFGT